jgi:hypothetical protein
MRLSFLVSLLAATVLAIVTAAQQPPVRHGFAATSASSAIGLRRWAR